MRDCDCSIRRDCDMAAMMVAPSPVVSMLIECGANVESVDVMGNDGFALASAFR